MEASASVLAMEEELERYKERLAALQATAAEHEEELNRLRAQRRASCGSLGGSSSVQREREIIFDPLNLNPFPDNPAGRQQRRRATKAVLNELLRQCAHTRGHAPVAPSSTAEATISASVVKRRGILRTLFTRMMDAREDVSVVVDLLPKTLRMKLRTLAYIVSRLKRAFAILKRCGSKEARENYYVVSAAVVPEPAADRDMSGMMRRVTDELNLPRAAGSVPHTQLAVRAAWQKLVENTAPIAVGEQVECTQGIGTVEALDADGTITIKLSHGKIVTFTSQGATLSLSFSRLGTAIRL